MGKKLGSLLLAVALVLIMGKPTMAAGSINVSLGEVAVAEGVLELQVITHMEDNTIPVTYEVSLDGEALPLISIAGVGEEAIPASYLFLVDISGSIKSSSMEEIKETLYAFAEGLGEGDNACLMLVGDTAYTGEFTSDKETLKAEIDGIERLSEDTNLYYGMNEALDILATNSQVHPRKCLVVLSDGQDDQITGITKEEVENKINEEHITVCSIATLGKKPSEQKQEAAKSLGSLSRMSPGGIHTLLGEAGVTSEEATKAVLENSNSFIVLRADVTAYASRATESYLEVKATAENIGTDTDGYQIKASRIKEGLSATSGEEITKTQPEGTETEGAESIEGDTTGEQDVRENPTEEDNGPDKWVIIGGVVAAIAVLAVMLMMFGRKKEVKKVETEVPAINPSVNVPEQKKVFTVAPAAAMPAQQVNAAPQNKGPEITVLLAKIGLTEREEKKLTIRGSFSIGRNRDKNDLAFETDSKVSSQHCVLEYDGNRLSVTDKGSLNGTYVNGVAIKQKFYLQDGDILAIGDGEWRVIFDVEKEG